MAEGISKGMFVVGLIIAIVISSSLGMVASSQFSFGPKGDTGDTGLKGDKGDIGPDGPLGTFTIADIAGLMPTPAYDSGWINLLGLPTHGSYRMLEHNLNTTTNLLVYVLIKTDQGDIYENTGTQNPVTWWIFDENENPNTKNEIGLYAMIPPNYQCRVMLWKIAEP